MVPFYKILDGFRLSNLERMKGQLVCAEFFAHVMSHHHIGWLGCSLKLASEILLPFRGIAEHCFISVLISCPPNEVWLHFGVLLANPDYIVYGKFQKLLIYPQYGCFYKYHSLAFFSCYQWAKLIASNRYYLYSLFLPFLITQSNFVSVKSLYIKS